MIEMILESSQEKEILIIEVVCFFVGQKNNATIL